MTKFWCTLLWLQDYEHVSGETSNELGNARNCIL